MTKYFGLVLLSLLISTYAKADIYHITVPGRLTTQTDRQGRPVHWIFLNKGFMPSEMFMTYNPALPANPAQNCQEGEYDVDLELSEADRIAGKYPKYTFRRVVRCRDTDLKR